MHCPTGEASTAELAGPIGVWTGRSTSLQPTGLPAASEVEALLDNHTGVNAPSSSGEPTPSVHQLNSTVQALANQMAWFVEQLTGETTKYEQGELDMVTPSQNTSTSLDAPLAMPGPSNEESVTVTDTLMGLEQFYDVGDNLAPDVGGHLSNIVNNLAKKRLSDDKLNTFIEHFVISFL